MPIKLPSFVRKLIYTIVTSIGNKNSFTNYKNTSPIMSIYDIPFNDIDGNPTSLKQFEGKKILIVNTASACGFTGEYTPLEELYKNQGDKIAVIAFPCNDFGAQESGSEEEIKQFCEINFKVSFPLMQKVAIKGENRHPLYKWLTDPALNGWNSEAPNWNFCKYVISEDGKLLHFLTSAVDPFDAKIVG